MALNLTIDNLVTKDINTLHDFVETQFFQSRAFSLQLGTQSNKKWKSRWPASFLFSHTTEWSAFGQILLWHEHLSSSSLLADLSATARYIDFSKTSAGWCSECSVSQPLTVSLCFPQTYISQNILKPPSVLQSYSQSAKPLPEDFISTCWSTS